MAYYYMWYWGYSIVFPISLIIFLICYVSCRVLCIRHINSDQAHARRIRTTRGNNQQTANQSADPSQAYTISTVVIQESSSPPSYKHPGSSIDLPPSYDEALVLANDNAQNKKQPEQV